MVVERGADGCRVVRAWEGATAICIAAGPSLTKEQLDKVKEAHDRGVKVGVVNDIFLVAPWADVLYAADVRWWGWYQEGLVKKWPWVSFTQEQTRQAMREFAGQRISIENGGSAVKESNVYVLKNLNGERLSDDPRGIHTGSNSGYQLLNICYLAGAKKIILVGYDMGYLNGKSHSHDGHKIKCHETAYHGFARRFDTTVKQLNASGVVVLNATPGSRIGCYPKVSLEEALQEPATS